MLTPTQSLSFLRVNLMSEQHFTGRWTGVASIVCPRHLAHDAHSGMSVSSRLLTREKGHEGRGAGIEAGLKSGWPGCFRRGEAGVGYRGPLRLLFARQPSPGTGMSTGNFLR